MADLGGDLNLTQCAASLPMPNGSPGGTYVTVTAVQMTLGWAMNTVTGATLPAFATGRANLSGAIMRRLSTTRGQLVDVVTPSTTANYGYDLQQQIGDDMTPRALGMISAGIVAELQKDERIIRAQATSTGTGNALLTDITVTDASGPFKLILAVTDVTTTLLTTTQ
jgi:hypothetical protein